MKKRKIKDIPLFSVIGFSGKINHALRILEASNELVYPVGKNVGIWAWKGNSTNKHGPQYLLKGHQSKIVALATSESGEIIASAENFSLGDWATVIIWSGPLRQEIGRHSIHREEIIAVAVAPDGSLVFSLGGETDGRIVVWKVASKKPINSTQVWEPGSGIPQIMCSAPSTPTVLGIGGRRILKVVSFDLSSKKFTSANANVGVMERHYTDMKIDSKEELMYCTTTTGDIVIIRLNLKNGSVSSSTPVLVSVNAPKAFSDGIQPQNKTKKEAIPSLTALVLLSSGDIITGDSKGFIRGFRQEPERSRGLPQAHSSKNIAPSSTTLVRAHGTMKIVCPKDPSKPLLRQLWCIRLGSYVTSLERRGKVLVVGNQESEIYEIFLGSLDELAFEMQVGRSLQIKNGIKPKEKELITQNNNYSTTSSSSERFSCLTDKVGSITTLNSFIPPSRLISTCPSGSIYDVTFPRDVSDLIVTAGEFGIRVWNVRNLEELLRVDLPDIACKACVVSSDLSVIFSGWTDGRVRGIGAETGVLKWVVDDAHHKSVNSLAVTEGGFMVSGGADGRVRTWTLLKFTRPDLYASVRQHRGEVTSVVLEKNKDVILSCGADGLCFLLTIPELETVFSLKSDTVFLDGCFLSRQEIVTVGSDGSVMVWYRADGSLIADLQTVQHPLTSVDISEDDKMLVTAEEEGNIKVWNWSKGRVLYESKGHNTSNTKIRISPDGELIVSVAKDGTILFWMTPKI